MKFMRRIRRGNVHPVYGTKFRKGNKGDKLKHLQSIQLTDTRTVLRKTTTKKGKVNVVYGSINCIKVYITKTILHWKK